MSSRPALVRVTHPILARAAPARDRIRRLAPVVVVSTVCMWPVGSLEPTPGLDTGWMAGLSFARRAGLEYGDDLIFTYGPLAYAMFPSSISRSFLVTSLVVVSMLCGCFAVLTLRLLREHTDRIWLAIAATGLMVLLAPNMGTGLAEAVLLALFATIIDFVVTRREQPRWWLVAIGSVTAILLLCKASVGVVGFGALLLFCLSSRPRASRLALGVGSMFVTVVVVWTALGQDLLDLLPWLRDVTTLSSGYSSAMGAEQANRSWELGFAVAVAVFLVWRLARDGHRAARHSEDRRRSVATVVVVALLVAALFVFIFKEGFVRHDTHSEIFFFAVVYMGTALPSWVRREGDDVDSAGAWWALAVVALVVSSGVPFATALDPTHSATWFSRATGALISPNSWNDGLDAARTTAQTYYELPPEVLAEVQGRSVHVDPYDVSVVWAYELEWKPAPVFQRYAAYTSSLDAKNAERLAAEDGPERILRSTDPPIDQRYDLLDAPRTMRAMICRFEPLTQTVRWQVLARSADRCGVMTELASADVDAGEAVEFPAFDAQNDALLMSVDFDLTGADHLRALLYKSDDYGMELDGRPFRLLPKTADVPGVVYLPPTAGWADPFRILGVAPTQLRLDHPARVTYFSITIAGADD